MLHHCAQEDLRQWDILVALLLFVVWKAPQASLGYTPFELTYGYSLHSLLDLVYKEREENGEVRVEPSWYVNSLMERLQITNRVAMDNLQNAQCRQKGQYNKQVRGI